MRHNEVPCETRRSPLKSAENVDDPDEEGAIRRSPRAFLLGKQGIKDPQLNPSQFYKHAELMRIFGAGKSPANCRKAQALIPLASPSATSKQFHHKQRRLSPQANNVRQTNNEHTTLDNSFSDLPPENETINRAAETSRSPREFKIRTKKRLDLSDQEDKKGPESPRLTFPMPEAIKAPTSKQCSLNEELWEAAENGDVEKILSLLGSIGKQDGRAEVNSTGIENRTALHYAVQEGKIEAVAALLRCGANPNAKTIHGRTPLHIACLQGNHEICKTLLDAAADVNVQDFDLNTPLHYASCYNAIKILKMLLEKKPDLTIKNKKGQSAIDITNSKITIALFWQFLKGGEEHKATKEGGADSDKNDNKDSKECNPKPSSPPVPVAAAADAIRVRQETKKTAPKTLKMNAPELAKAQDAKRKEKKGILIGPRLVKKFDSNRLKVVTIEQSKEDDNPKSTKYHSDDVSIPKEMERLGTEMFTPVRQLGKGSFGEVYLVQRKSTKQYYAMKVLLKKQIFAQNLLRYVYTERNVQGLLSHPFTVRLHCTFQTANKLYLVLDYCPGGDLGGVLQREKKLSKERARAYLCEILLALEELHKNEIIYRDLKPDNIVLDASGHALLTDFGLSKEGMSATDYTQSFCGSVAYLAPEVLRKAGHGRSVDWYLLGTLLYEMLVGIPPYFSRNKEKLFDNIKRGPLQVPQSMPSDALDLIVQLLNRDPKTRLGSGPGDAEEIKQHSFFAGVDWAQVRERKLAVPKPTIKPIVSDGTALDALKDYGDCGNDEGRLNKWTFISPDFPS